MWPSWAQHTCLFYNCWLVKTFVRILNISTKRNGSFSSVILYYYPDLQYVVLLPAIFHFALLVFVYPCWDIFHMSAHCCYITAGSPTVTSLTFDDQSRTLTCTSTGGPATTVTWKRDGVVITLNTTYQQTKRLVDPGNGAYQTLLTIDPSVGWSDMVGTYSCTVENVRGESSETVVVPGETRTFTTWPRHTSVLNYW